MEELKTQVCPICGITREEQEAQEKFVSAQARMLQLRWERIHAPNEPVPGLPLTDENRVHYALFLLGQNDASKKPNAQAIQRAVREAGADYNSVVWALNYAKEHRQM